jgi:hypothetical protein
LRVQGPLLEQQADAPPNKPPAGVQLHLFLQALVVELQGAGAGSTTKENAMVVDQRQSINRDEICLLLLYCTVFTGMQCNDV